MLDTIKLGALRAAMLVAGLATGLASVNPAAAQQSEQAGVSAAVRGEVLLARAQTVGRQVESGEPILLNDLIESGPSGGLQVLLLDESVLTLGPTSRIEIDRFIYDAAAQGGSMALRMISGSMRFVAGKIASGNPADMEVLTPLGVIGIRGTIGQVSVITPQQAQQNFPDQAAQSNPQPNQPVVFAALVGPGPTAQGGGQGSFTFSSPNGSVDLNRPGGAVLATPGQPPVFFIAPPGSIDNLNQQISGGGGQTTQSEQETGDQSDGSGVNSAAVQQAGGSSSPTPISTVLNQFEQTTDVGDQAGSAIDASTSASAAATGVTLQEVLAVNSGTAGQTIDISGTISGKLQYFFDFSARTFDLQATDLQGGGLASSSIKVLGGSATLPSDSRRALSVGNNGEDFAADVTNCDNCSMSAVFPSTSSFKVTVTNQGASGATAVQIKD